MVLAQRGVKVRVLLVDAKHSASRTQGGTRPVWLE